MQYADDVLQSCAFETCLILLIRVTPINSIKQDFEKGSSEAFVWCLVSYYS